MSTQDSKPHDLPFSDAARQLIADAHSESEHLNHEYVGTEHLVLALTRPSRQTATLASLGIDGEQVRALLTAAIRPGRVVPAATTTRSFTSRTKRALALAAEDARNSGLARIEVEHILVGLFQERLNIGAEVLRQCGLTLERVTEDAQRLAADGTTH